MEHIKSEGCMALVKTSQNYRMNIRRMEPEAVAKCTLGRVLNEVSSTEKESQSCHDMWKTKYQPKLVVKSVNICTYLHCSTSVNVATDRFVEVC